MTIDDVLFFDTETTGIPDRNADWATDYMGFPHIVQLAWIHGEKAESHIIYPDGWEIPEEAVAVHGITTEYAREHGEAFAIIVDKFIADCLEAGLICGHNIHFDTQMVKANILRDLGREYYDVNDVESALYKGKRLDTMRPAMKWVDARMANGRLKFPNLSELYSRCFPGETLEAHDALEDTKAVARCLPVLLQNGLLELKLKEYPDEQAKPTPEQLTNAAKIAAEAATKFAAAQPIPEYPLGGIVQKTPGNGPILNANEKGDKLPVQEFKGPENENSAKITGVMAELLQQDNF